MAWRGRSPPGGPHQEVPWRVVSAAGSVPSAETPPGPHANVEGPGHQVPPGPRVLGRRSTAPLLLALLPCVPRLLAQPWVQPRRVTYSGPGRRARVSALWRLEWAVPWLLCCPLSVPAGLLGTTGVGAMSGCPVVPAVVVLAWLTAADSWTGSSPVCCSPDARTATVDSRSANTHCVYR